MMNMIAITAALGIALTMSSVANAAIKTKSIQYKVDGKTHIGYLAWDDSAPSNEKRPGILVIHEWWGLTDYPMHRAEQLAQLGYIAFCADMYGEGKVTKDPKQAQTWMESSVKDPRQLYKIFSAALDQLRAQPAVDGKRIAAIGYCFGGGVCLNAARMGADLAGVVSFHGSLQGFKKAEKGAVKPRLLVCHGANDTFETPENVMEFEKEMTDAGANWQLNIYSGAVHAFTNPDADKFGIPGIGYNLQADRSSWQAMKNFFNEIFNPQVQK